MNGRTALLVAGLLGALGVGLGAFGAHALKGWLQSLPDGGVRLGWWHTAVQYQMWHALLLVGVGSWMQSGGAGRPLRVAAMAVCAGVLLFSGSLYAMTLSGVRVLGAITPLGGVSFIAAWVAVAVAAWRSRP